MSRFNVSRLHDACREIFIRAGVPAEDAEMLAEVLVTTDMRGVHSHGVVRSARYIDCIRAGGIRPSAELEILNDTPCAVQVSAAGGLGIPASVKALELLLKRAEKQPVTVVTVNHSDHYGAAGYYAMRGAEAGFLTFSMSNTVPLIAAPGGAASVIGNNPFAYAAPGARHRAVLFDVCMSKVASGKIEIAAREGRRIPRGWILNAKGEATEDPQDIYNGGIMLPFAEHKGYGFAIMVELMTGVLGLSGLLSGVHSWNTLPGRDADTGHCFLALNPAFFGGAERFRARVDAMIDELKRSPVAPDAERTLYPGELEFEREADARANGVPLPEASVRELQRAAALTGVRLNLE